MDDELAKYLRNKRRLLEDFRVIVNFTGKQTIGRKKEEMQLPNSCSIKKPKKASEKCICTKLERFKICSTYLVGRRVDLSGGDQLLLRL